MWADARTLKKVGRLFENRKSGVTSNFESTFFSKGKSTDFGKVKSTP